MRVSRALHDTTAETLRSVLTPDDVELSLSSSMYYGEVSLHVTQTAPGEFDVHIEFPTPVIDLNAEVDAFVLGKLVAEIPLNSLTRVAVTRVKLKDDVNLEEGNAEWYLIRSGLRLEAAFPFISIAFPIMPADDPAREYYDSDSVLLQQRRLDVWSLQPLGVELEFTTMLLSNFAFADEGSRVMLVLEVIDSDTVSCDTCPQRELARRSDEHDWQFKRRKERAGSGCKCHVFRLQQYNLPRDPLDRYASPQTLHQFQTPRGTMTFMASAFFTGVGLCIVYRTVSQLYRVNQLFLFFRSTAGRVEQKQIAMFDRDEELKFCAVLDARVDATTGEIRAEVAVHVDSQLVIIGMREDEFSKKGVAVMPHTILSMARTVDGSYVLSGLFDIDAHFEAHQYNAAFELIGRYACEEPANTLAATYCDNQVVMLQGVPGDPCASLAYFTI